jgi:hypothetical protein
MVSYFAPKKNPLDQIIRAYDTTSNQEYTQAINSLILLLFAALKENDDLDLYSAIATLRCTVPELVIFIDKRNSASPAKIF